jgi:predicted nucleic acid-binding protein
LARRRAQIAVPIVLDASLTAGWHFEDERSAGADAVLDSLTQDSGLVPLLWWFEIRNVTVLGERRGRATREQTATFLDLLSRLPIRMDSLPDERHLFELSRTYGLTFYDASYLELAQREEIGLATLDKALARAARAEGVPLIVDAP